MSPGCPFYVLSLRRITSIERGIAPGGIFVGSYWILIFWKSANRDFFISSSHTGESQLFFRHFLGSVYLNCCTTSLLSVPQLLHLNTPTKSSGRTSLVLVTVPLNDLSFPKC
jgi:hypothetical protein